MGITKYILPVVIGAMLGVILITPTEMWIEKQTTPPGAFVFLLINYAMCSFIAGVVCTLVAGRTLVRPAVVVGIVLTLAGLYNARHLQHPVWFTILNVVDYLPFTYLGYMVARRKEVVPE